MRHDLAASLHAAGVRRDVTLPPMRTPAGFAPELERAFRRVLLDGYALRAAVLLDARRVRVGMIHDDAAFMVPFEALRGAFARSLASLRNILRRIMGVWAVRHAATWTSQIEAVAGKEVAAAVPHGGAQSEIELALQKNMALIRGVTDEVAKRAEVAITDLITSRADEAKIAKAFDAAFGWGAARSRLIARDQTGKFWTTLNRIRMQQAGVTEYEWWTKEDERVRGNPDGLYPKSRPSHWDRHGQIFKWDSPPSDGHPGEPILCRCIARPIIRASKR